VGVIPLALAFESHEVGDILEVDELPRAQALPIRRKVEPRRVRFIPTGEVEKIARFRELNPSQKALMRSARKECRDFLLYALVVDDASVGG
jgi:hypothetical protein